MLSLSIRQIQTRVQANNLPAKYTLQTPVSISSNELIWTLTQFKQSHQMIYFISQLSENKGVTINVGKKKIQQGSADRFVHFYAEHVVLSSKLDMDKQQHILSFLSRHTFKGKQLEYLLKNLSSDSIAQFVLATKCFEQSDLLACCNNFDMTTNLSARTINLLYDLFNKERRWNESLTPVLDMHYYAYRVGHVLGLENNILLNVNGKKYIFSTNYSHAHPSLKILCENVESYSKRYPSVVFDAIYIALKRNVVLFNENDTAYKADAHRELLHQYRQGELTFISCSWPGHTVAVVLYGDYLIYANRGEGGDRHYGSKIFKLKNPLDINHVIMSGLVNSSSRAQFHRVLERVIDFKHPVVRFDSKPQKFCTCTFVNPKASIEPMIVLLRAGFNATENEVKEIAHQERWRTKYKHITSFIRNREIDQLVKNMFYAKNPDLIRFYALLVCDIIMLHHGGGNNTVKNIQEEIRALDLFDRTPEKVQKILRENEGLMKIIDNLRNLQPPPLKPTLLWRHQTTVRNNQGYSTHKVEVDKNYIVAIDGVETPKTPYSFANVRKLCSRQLKNW